MRPYRGYHVARRKTISSYLPSQHASAFVPVWFQTLVPAAPTTRETVAPAIEPAAPPAPNPSTAGHRPSGRPFFSRAQRASHESLLDEGTHLVPHHRQPPHCPTGSASPPADDDRDVEIMVPPRPPSV